MVTYYHSTTITNIIGEFFPLSSKDFDRFEQTFAIVARIVIWHCKNLFSLNKLKNSEHCYLYIQFLSGHKAPFPCLCKFWVLLIFFYVEPFVARYLVVATAPKLRFFCQCFLAITIDKTKQDFAACFFFCTKQCRLFVLHFCCCFTIAITTCRKLSKYNEVLLCIYRPCRYGLPSHGHDRFA